MNYISKYFSFIILMLSVNAYALPCSTTGSLTSKGENMEQVLAECGAPYDKKTYTKNVITASRLVYYKNLAGKMLKLSVTVNNNQVSNIEVDGANLVSSTICGRVINVGSNAQSIISACGNPNYTETLGSIDIEVTEMKYSTISPEMWVFENGQLVDWK